MDSVDDALRLIIDRASEAREPHTPPAMQADKLLRAMDHVHYALLQLFWHPGVIGEAAKPTGVCQCGCGDAVPDQAFFKPGHDQVALHRRLAELYSSTKSAGKVSSVVANFLLATDPLVKKPVA